MTFPPVMSYECVSSWSRDGTRYVIARTMKTHHRSSRPLLTCFVSPRHRNGDLLDVNIKDVIKQGEGVFFLYSHDS